MSRRTHEEEYNDYPRATEIYSDEDENYESLQDEEQRDIAEKDETENVCNLVKIIKMYTVEKGLPLCEYLNPQLMEEFIQ
jgi:hypothetical protein